MPASWQFIAFALELVGIMWFSFSPIWSERLNAWQLALTSRCIGAYTAECRQPTSAHTASRRKANKSCESVNGIICMGERSRQKKNHTETNPVDCRAALWIIFIIIKCHTLPLRALHISRSCWCLHLHIIVFIARGCRAILLHLCILTRPRWQTDSPASLMKWYPPCGWWGWIWK